MTARAVAHRVAGTVPEEPPAPSACEPGRAAGVCALASSPEDRELVGRLLRGDEEAFVALVGRFHDALRRLALALVVDGAVAEEIVQETWLAVLNGLGSFEGRSSVRSWIFGILATRARTRVLREQQTLTFSELCEDEPAVDPDRFTASGAWSAPPGRWNDGTPESLLLHREAPGVVDQVIAALPAAQCAVVTLRDVEHLEAAEVCNVLQISETNQRVLLHRGRSKLRAALEAYVSGT